jgi:dolichol kinase
MLPNLILSLGTLPAPLIPAIGVYETLNPIHWLLTCVPLCLASQSSATRGERSLLLETPGRDLLVLVYPLHQHLCSILHHLTTTSLLTAELQLLSVGLINIFLLSYSPQTEILKALLWVAGVGIILLCGPVIRWGIILARVPKWRFSRSAAPARGFSVSRFLRSVLLLFTRPRRAFPPPDFEHTTAESANSSDDDYGLNLSRVLSIDRARRRDSLNGCGGEEAADVQARLPDGSLTSPSRRHTLPSLTRAGPQSKTHTPSGRRKRSASSTVQSFFSLTRAQATARKWLYAGYVYVCILGIILVGVREYMRVYALSGNEPIGWALGYLFGDLPWFRFQVVKANLQRWILLPPRSDNGTETCHIGRVEHIRHAFLGEANTRLFLSGYFLAIIVTGLAIVFRLSPIYEVDTRRKVFHFMMVAMFLPATFVDPAFAALGLSVVLAAFLLLDLLRASQLPPLSKPIANFLTPYVDGRDLRGPVVVSHIFLLIGCAIPLWLSLAALPRTAGGVDGGALAGWEVPTRDISMVSGVVCVGLGDAAASLIGRRWGRHKWVWGGGKSLEGSVAFGLAVFAGLMAAGLWLRIGGWPVSGQSALSQAGASQSFWQGWGKTVRETAVCASMASLTEAVLTGGNDNVVVPVVLWACVKSTGI